MKYQRLEWRGAGREPGCRARRGGGVLPGVGLLPLVWLVGLYAVAVALIVLALRVRGLRRQGGREVA
jgi:hypothetical protein